MYNHHHHPNQQSRKETSISSCSSSSSDEIQKKYRKKYQKLLPKLEHVTVDSYIMITEQLTEVTNDKLNVCLNDDDNDMVNIYMYEIV